MRATAVIVLGLVGCIGEETPRADIEAATVRVNWTDATTRYVRVTVPEIPCYGTEEGFLFDSGEDCNTAPWSVTIDGVALAPMTVQCEAAHEGLFGPVDKYCTGLETSAPLPESANEDVEIVISNGDDDVKHTLYGVRRTYAFTQQTAADLEMETPGVVRVDEVELSGTRYEAYFTLDGRERRGEARVDTDTTGLLTMAAPFGSDPGEYHVRVLAYTRQGDISVGIPVEGTLTIAAP